MIDSIVDECYSEGFDGIPLPFFTAFYVEVLAKMTPAASRAIPKPPSTATSWPQTINSIQSSIPLANVFPTPKVEPTLSVARTIANLVTMGRTVVFVRTRNSLIQLEGLRSITIALSTRRVILWVTKYALDQCTTTPKAWTTRKAWTAALYP